MRKSLLFGIAAAFVLAQPAAAVWQCGEPAPAPQYQPNEKWVWKDEKGNVRRAEVVSVERGLTRFRYHTENTAFYNADYVIEKVITKDGRVVERAEPEFNTIGVKTIDFPLVRGKEWEYTFRTKVRGPQGDLKDRLLAMSLKVTGCEEIAVKAGRFLALKIPVKQTAESGKSGDLLLWWSPVAKQYVKGHYVPSPYWQYSGLIDSELVEIELK